jgi:hypothetical protein
VADGRYRSANATQRTAAAAIVLLALGVVFAVLYRVENGAEHHSYNAGARAANTVHVTLGQQYEISTPGGINTLLDHGVSIDKFTCSFAQAGTGATNELDVTPLGSSTRTVHAVATFIGPVTGQVHIACNGFVGGVYVDDADDAPADPAGRFLLLATIAFTFGAALGMSALYRRGSAGRAGSQPASQRQPRPTPDYRSFLAPNDDDEVLHTGDDQPA